MSYFTQGTFSRNCRTTPTWTVSAVTSKSYFTDSRGPIRETGRTHTAKNLNQNMKINLNNMKNCKSRYIYTRSG
jgi:hypothetical protein